MLALPLLPWMKKRPLPASAVSIENTHCPVPPNPLATVATGAKPLPPDDGGGGGGGVSWACATRGAASSAKANRLPETSARNAPRVGAGCGASERVFVGAVVMPTPYHARRKRSNQGL